jgi:hypothetical protein
MNMNSIVTRYKKTAVLAAFVAAISISSVISAGCGACAAAAAIRQSIKDAQAAALNSGKKALEDELDDLDGEEAADRAAREALADPCNPFFSCNACEGECGLNCKLQTLFNCCVATNKEVRRQGHEANKCCKRIRHELNEIEDQSETCCSVLEELMVSQIDQTAVCCSVTDSVLGDPTVQIVSLQDCFIDVLNFVNTNNDDVMTWLKRLYVLMYQVFSCTCCID